jgi:hypothetical protein
LKKRDSQLAETQDPQINLNFYYLRSDSLNHFARAPALSKEHTMASRDESVYMAKLAEQAERYDEMVGSS